MLNKNSSIPFPKFGRNFSEKILKNLQIMLASSTNVTSKEFNP